MKATVSETAIRLSFDADRAELAKVTLICCDYDEDPIMVIVRGYQVRAHLDAHEADGLTEAILARYQIGKELGHFECDAQGTPCLSAATAGPTSPRGPTASHLAPRADRPRASIVLHQAPRADDPHRVRAGVPGTAYGHTGRPSSPR